jgi:Mg-chelatase subunit ChlD
MRRWIDQDDIDRRRHRWAGRGARTRVRHLALVPVLLALVSLASAWAPGVRAESAQRTRLDVMFVLDNSGSMKRNDPGSTTHQVVSDFAEGLAPDTRMGIVVFDTDARVAIPLTRIGSREQTGRWQAGLGQVDYSGQLTNSPAGVERALYELKTHGREGSRKAIILITDGLVDTGDRTLDIEKKRWLKEDVAREASQAGVRIYGIAFTEGADVELIQALALQTRGQYFRVLRAGDIPRVLSEIGQSIAAAADPLQDMEALAAGKMAAPLTAPAPVSAAPSTRTRGVVLLALGLLVAVGVLLVPVINRRRFRPPTSSAFMTGVAPVVKPAPAAPQPGRVPAASLIDVATSSTDGLLPFNIDTPRTSIGRDIGNDIVILRDSISSFHASIDFKDGYYYLHDHRSTNGTQLNGKRLEPNERVELKSGDRIDFAVYEFRFVIAAQEPRGNTVILDGTSLPSLVDDHEETDVQVHEVTSYDSAFSRCLSTHLDKIRALGMQHRVFVDEAFGEQLTEVLNLRASELIERCEVEQVGQTLEISKSGVHYTICVLPHEMKDAAGWFTTQYGGYARLLTSLLETWTSPERRCHAICVITFGMVEDAWISVTIVPAKDSGDVAEVMSFEFLSEDERRRALSLDITEVGRDAIG